MRLLALRINALPPTVINCAIGWTLITALLCVANSHPAAVLLVLPLGSAWSLSATVTTLDLIPAATITCFGCLGLWLGLLIRWPQLTPHITRIVYVVMPLHLAAWAAFTLVLR